MARPGDAQNNTRVLRFYDQLGASYAEARSRGLLGRIIQRDVKTILALLASHPGDRVLDAGCGSGMYARQLATDGMRVCAVDFSPRMVEAVRPFVAEAHQADVGQLELGRRFDKVLCIGVLEFVADPAVCIENLANHLDEGGCLVVLAPRRSVGGLVYKLWQRARNGIRVHLSSGKSLNEAARRSGLNLKHIEELPLKHNLIMLWERQRVAE